jgi:hypothetical protein
VKETKEIRIIMRKILFDEFLFFSSDGKKVRHIIAMEKIISHQ